LVGAHRDGRGAVRIEIELTLLDPGSPYRRGRSRPFRKAASPGALECRLLQIIDLKELQGRSATSHSDQWWESILTIASSRTGGSTPPPCSRDMTGRDGFGWLGWEDSNSKMSAQAIYLKLLNNFPYAHPELGSTDRSRLSCGVGICSSGLISDPIGHFCADVDHRCIADPEMMRRLRNQQHHCSLCAGLCAKRACV
jgi:hypothetical protein